MVGYLDGDRHVRVRVLAVGSGGVLIDHPDGRRLVVPADLHDLQAQPPQPTVHDERTRR
jgi:hypothetical protein